MIQVVVVEDIKELSEQFCALISKSEFAKCVASFGNAEDAIAWFRENKADVLLMDINLPGKSGIEAASEIRALSPSTQIMMCSVYNDDDKIFASIKAGANGYLLKSEADEKLAASIKTLSEGGSPINPGIARRIISFLHSPQKSSSYDLLSPREKEILDYLSQGYRYKEIASMLEIAIDTIRKHTRNIYSKLQVQSRTEALNKIYLK